MIKRHAPRADHRCFFRVPTTASAGGLIAEVLEHALMFPSCYRTAVMQRLRADELLAEDYYVFRVRWAYGPPYGEGEAVESGALAAKSECTSITPCNYEAEVPRRERNCPELVCYWGDSLLLPRCRVNVEGERAGQGGRCQNVSSAFVKSAWSRTATASTVQRRSGSPVKTNRE